METALLTRHAESAYSARGLVNGDPAVAVDLTDEGVRQARALGEALAGEPFDVCVVTDFGRTRRTAELALGGRSVPFVVVPDLNDPDYGDFEGRPLEEYRGWLSGRASSTCPPGGSETRHDLVRRYARGFSALLARPEQTVLAVLHSLPLAYAFGVLDGRDIADRMDLVGYAEARRVSADDLELVVSRLEEWCASPTW